MYPPYKKAEDFAGSVAALFGLPLKKYNEGYKSNLEQHGGCY